MHKSEDNNTRIDYGIILCVMLLAIISLVTIYSTTVLIQGGSIRTTISQAVWYVLGTGVAATVMLFDSQQLWKMTDYLYWAGVTALILTLFFYDRNMAATTNTMRWVNIPIINFTFQPSEFVKFPYILMLAKLTTFHHTKYQKQTLKSDFILLGKLIAYAAIPITLITFQRDLGTTIVYIAILGGIILISGIQWIILGPLILSALIAVVGAVLLVVYNREFLHNVFGLQDYQFSRVDTWLNPYSDTNATTYQVTQTFKAVGSGGMFGKGLGASEVYVPVRESDMIFATIGENFGFVGAAFLIFVYFVLCYNMIKIVYDTKNEFYAYITTGVIMMIVFHVVENIGMNLGLLPITGIPLPFISQGGSSLVGNMMGIGLVMSMRFHHRSYMFSGEEEEFH